MPGLTSPLNLPYPLYTEPAAAATQIQDLAEEIDDVVTAQQAQIAAVVDRKRAAASAPVGSPQSIPNNTATNLTYTVEDFDNDTMINLGVNNTAITATTAGLYLVSASVRFAGNITGNRQLHISLNAVDVGGKKTQAVTDGAETAISLSQLVFATVGQIFRSFVIQDSGGALNVTQRSFSAVRVSG